VIEVYRVGWIGRSVRWMDTFQNLCTQGRCRRRGLRKRVPRKPVTIVPTVTATIVDGFIVVIWLDMIVRVQETNRWI
jgi:hypothetical protein